MLLILQDKFWVVHILLICTVQFKLAQFPEDHHPHTIVVSLILFLRWVTAFAHKIIDNLVPTFTYPFYYFIPLWVFHTSVCWWSFITVWVTAILLKFPGLFSVFWPIFTALSFEWFPLVFVFPILPLPLPILWWLYRTHRLQMVSPSLSCSIVFSVP